MCEVNIIVPELTPEELIQKRGDIQVLHAWYNPREHEQEKGEANLITQTTAKYSNSKEPKP